MLNSSIQMAQSNALDAHHFNLFESLRTGEYYPPYPYSAAGSGESLTANRLYGIPFYVARDRTYDRIAIHCRTAQASANIRLGYFDSSGSNLAPGALVDDAGEVDVSTTGVKVITVSYALTKGLYWLGAYNETASVVVSRAVNAPGALLGISATEFTTGYNMWYYSGTYAALPDPFPTPTDKFSRHVLVVALRLSTND